MHTLTSKTAFNANDQAEAEEFRETLLLTRGSHERMPQLIHAFLGGELSIEVAALVLPLVWTGGNPNMPQRPIEGGHVRELLSVAGWMSDGPERPTTPTTLYRAGVLDRDGTLPDTWDSFRWTSDRSIAERYRSWSWSPDCIIIRADQVPPALVLGRFDERQEAEHVVDPMTVDYVAD